MARSRTVAAVTFMVVGASLPPLTWFVGDAWIRAKAALDPIPDQGAMLIVFLSFWASVAVGSILGIVGLILFFKRSMATGSRA